VGTLWAGTDDGLIWLTRDGGEKWNEITPKELTPWSKVTQIAASHFDDDSAYASVSRFRINDLRPYIYRAHDGGKTWKLITSGLPDFGPVDAVREDPVRKGLLFAGTENSVWVSFDDGDRWQSLQLNLPHTSMRDLWIHDDDLIVATHGRSFWILDDIAPLREASASLASEPAHLFTPAQAWRIQRNTNTDTPLPPDEPAAANPPDGAILDYYLAHATSSPITIEIRDVRGQLVRRFSSADQPDITDAELQKQLIPLYWIRPARTLSAEAGMHRWVWDLHYTPPVAVRHEYPIAAIPGDTPRLPLGPTALPGQYTARLTVGGKTYTAPLTVKMDPRVKTSPAHLEKKFQTETRLSALMSQTSEAVLQAGSMRDQLQKLEEQATGATKDSVQAFQKEIAALLGGPPGPFSSATEQTTLSQVSGHVTTLYGQVWPVDAEPTVAQFDAVAATEDEAAQLIKRWETLKSDLRALNGELRAAHLPEVKPESDAHKEEAPLDEE
ncbi:MAG: glycoside hydrolase, partial [Candidatus Sulfotelmatobacter sp.]